MQNDKIVKLLLTLMSESEETPEIEKQGDLRIVILQRGWIFVGNYYEEGENCRLENASCIRNWGTTKGLGELAKDGPTSSTKLDPTSIVRFHKFGCVAMIDCNEKVWKK